MRKIRTKPYGEDGVKMGKRQPRRWLLAADSLTLGAGLLPLLTEAYE